MIFLKIKEWLRKRNQTPQFDVIQRTRKVELEWTQDLKLKSHKTTNTSVILAARRIKDRQVFDLGYPYKCISNKGDAFRIAKFHDDLVHVDYYYLFKNGTVEIDKIVMSGEAFVCFAD